MGDSAIAEQHCLLSIQFKVPDSACFRGKEDPGEVENSPTTDHG